MFYKNCDYTIRMTDIDGNKRYFIKFHSLCDSSEHEITYEVFMLYLKEFNKPLERQRNEQRRHLDGGDIESSIELGKLMAHVAVEEQYILKCSIESVLNGCTSAQQRRFNLYYVQGYSYSEIARMEKCDYSTVRETILAVREKILKNIF